MRLLFEQIRGRLLDECGQGTAEYVIVGVVIMIVTLGLASIWQFASDGTLASIISGSASHSMNSVQGVADVMAF